MRAEGGACLLETGLEGSIAECYGALASSSVAISVSCQLRGGGQLLLYVPAAVMLCLTVDPETDGKQARTENSEPMTPKNPFSWTGIPDTATQKPR